MMEPPYGIIWDRWKRGNVIPVLGAGASLVGRPDGTKWDANNPTCLPSGLELAHFLAEQSQFPSQDSWDRDDLAKVSSYYADIAGRQILRACLRQVLSPDVERGALHDFIAAVPAHQIIIVTNYDTLLEQAFDKVGKPYDLVIYPAEREDYANAIWYWQHGAPEPQTMAPNELDIDPPRTVIYKMHGTIMPKDKQWDNFVITEEDYVEFLSRMTTNTAVPARFIQHFRERSFLFLGYSLRDWNLRVVMRNLSKSLLSRCATDDGGVLPSWAIQRSPSELEKALWMKRNVYIFDLPLAEFARKMMQERRGG